MLVRIFIPSDYFDNHMLTHGSKVGSLHWPPQDQPAKVAAQTAMTAQVQYLRDLAPNSGAYVNEVLSLSRYFPLERLIALE